MRIQFGSYWLDDQRFILEREGLRVSIRPKVFDLLAYLARDRDRVVPREELVRALWGGAVVGTGSLSGLVNELRKLLREDGRGPSSIRTVHARGYQFVAQLNSVEEEMGDGIRPALASAPAIREGAERCPIPDVLPAPIERALWLHLREDVDRIEKIAAWLEQLRLEATASERERMEWKHGVKKQAVSVRAMRTVEASAPRTKAAESEPPANGGESNRSA